MRERMRAGREGDGEGEERTNEGGKRKCRMIYSDGLEG